MYKSVTRDIVVSVYTDFLSHQSDPEQGVFVWAYHIRIENTSGRTVQLLRRYWRITDARGRTLEVRGNGVVGEQPVLEPGASFEYSSGTPLTTFSGFMVGQYHMVDLDGEEFWVDIPEFSLDSPFEATNIH